MAPWKSPGLDGFPIGFYHNIQKLIGNNVITYIKDSWNKVANISEVYCTDLFVIPKVGSPQIAHHFGPTYVIISIKFLAK